LLTPQDVVEMDTINNNKKIVCFIFRILQFLKLSIFYTLTITGLILQKKIIHTKILVAPLDWGLGHATRCIPLIKFLQQSDCEIIIAAYMDQLVLLNQEFPGIRFIPLKGYNVNYSKYKRWLSLKILWQSPKILLTIRRENKWLQKIIKQLNIDIVISDNRYGLYTKQVPCIFITHQLLIKAPYQWLENFIQKINYKYINRYTECWVPDVDGNNNIGGSLSHPKTLPAIPIRYIGALSRFERSENTEKKYNYLFVISGPEPQRTILEKKIFGIMSKLKGPIMMVRGKPGEITIPPAFNNCSIKNHVTTQELQQLLHESELIISRCGYTTVMELLSLKKKSLLIPTPGQTEQEYLAQHLMRQKWCYCCNQEEDLLEHIQQAKDFEFHYPTLETNRLKSVVKDFLERIN
jgi:uncharacterized protein (TIGR00661 family)